MSVNTICDLKSWSINFIWDTNLVPSLKVWPAKILKPKQNVWLKKTIRIIWTLFKPLFKLYQYWLEAKFLKIDDFEDIGLKPIIENLSLKIWKKTFSVFSQEYTLLKNDSLSTAKFSVFKIWLLILSTANPILPHCGLCLLGFHCNNLNQKIYEYAF